MPDHDAANNAKLVAAMAGIPPERRTARFRATLALADVAGPLGDEIILADGVCEGLLLEAPRGTGGFGYDPLFLLPDLRKTAAQLDARRKNELSHRAQALRKLAQALPEWK